MRKNPFVVILVFTVILFSLFYLTYRLTYYEPYVMTSSAYSNKAYLNIDRRIADIHREFEIFIGVFLAFLSFSISGVSFIILDHYTEWFTPITHLEGTLIRKDINLRAVHRGFGNAISYHFDMITSSGEAISLFGDKGHYAVLMEGNLLKLAIKKNEIKDFELLSVNSQDES